MFVGENQERDSTHVIMYAHTQATMSYLIISHQNV